MVDASIEGTVLNKNASKGLNGRRTSFMLDAKSVGRVRRSRHFKQGETEPTAPFNFKRPAPALIALGDDPDAEAEDNRPQKEIEEGNTAGRGISSAAPARSPFNFEHGQTGNAAALSLINSEESESEGGESASEEVSEGGEAVGAAKGKDHFAALRGSR